jgi:hypothetical protein
MVAFNWDCTSFTSTRARSAAKPSGDRAAGAGTNSAYNVCFSVSGGPGALVDFRSEEAAPVIYAEMPFDCAVW